MSAAGAGLVLGRDGRFSGRAGNSFAGCLVVVGDRLRLLQKEGHLALYGGLRGELEPVLSRVLLSGPRWSIDGGRLLLEEDDGVTLLLTARDGEPASCPTSTTTCTETSRPPASAPQSDRHTHRRVSQA